MRRVRYGVGMSLDACIADAEGGVGFLTMDRAYDPRPFFAAIDTMLMGRHTYEVALKMGAKGGGYPGLRSYVFSRTLRPEDHPGVTISPDAVVTVTRLRREPGDKDIWLCGGGALFASLIEARLVDTVEVGISPVLVGGGIPLAGSLPLPKPVKLALTHHEVLPSGMLVLSYDVRYGRRSRT